MKEGKGKSSSTANRLNRVLESPKRSCPKAYTGQTFNILFPFLKVSVLPRPVQTPGEPEEELARAAGERESQP